MLNHSQDEVVVHTTTTEVQDLVKRSIVGTRLCPAPVIELYFIRIVIRYLFSCKFCDDRFPDEDDLNEHIDNQGARPGEAKPCGNLALSRPCHPTLYQICLMFQKKPHLAQKWEEQR